MSGSSSGGEVSEFMTSDTNVGLDLVSGSMKSQGGTVGKEGADDGDALRQSGSWSARRVRCMDARLSVKMVALWGK